MHSELYKIYQIFKQINEGSRWKNRQSKLARTFCLEELEWLNVLTATNTYKLGKPTVVKNVVDHSVIDAYIYVYVMTVNLEQRMKLS